MNDDFTEQELIEIYNNIPQIFKSRIKVIKIAEESILRNNTEDN